MEHKKNKRNESGIKNDTQLLPLKSFSATHLIQDDTVSSVSRALTCVWLRDQFTFYDLSSLLPFFLFCQVLFKAVLTYPSVNPSSYMSLRSLSGPIKTRALHPAGVVGGYTCGENKICIVKIRQCTICFWSSSTYLGGIPLQCLFRCT